MEFPLLIGSGVTQVDAPGLLVGDDGQVYCQDDQGNRVGVCAALAGSLTGGSDFVAISHQSPDDGSGGAYVEHAPMLLVSPEAIVFSCMPPDADDMSPGNFAIHLDLETKHLVVTALDDDGVTITGAVALS